MALHLAQLTDLHVLAPGRVSDLGFDSNGSLAVAVERLGGLSPAPDAVVLTGDVTDHGTPTEFAHLVELLGPLDQPILPVAGNHDERLAMASAFPGIERAGPEPFWQWSTELDGVRIIAIDTTIEGRHDGELCATRLGWLDDELTRHRDRPTIVCMHHPPIRTGIWWMDAGGLRRGADELRAVIARHPQVRRVICGHHHRSIITGWGSTIVSVAPSTSHQIHLDLVPETPARFTDEPAAFHLHVVDGDDVLTHVVDCTPPETLDLSELFGGWEGFRDGLREGRPMHK